MDITVEIIKLVADIKMNRIVDLDAEPVTISPGSFVFRFVDKDVEFDFDESITSEGNTADEIHVECQHLDAASFPEAANLTEEEVRRIQAIPEFFVFTGEKEETNLRPVALKACTLEYYIDDEIKCVGIPDSICKKAVMACCL